MKSVLIIEDDLMMADMLEDRLLRKGYTVLGIARTVEEAGVLGKRHKPAYAVVDVRLADGGTGMEAVKQLRGNGRVRVLYASANIDYVKLTTRDGHACIKKPFDLSDIAVAFDVIDEIVRNGASALPRPPGFQLLTPEGAMQEPRSLADSKPRKLTPDQKRG